MAATQPLVQATATAGTRQLFGLRDRASSVAHAQFIDPIFGNNVADFTSRLDEHGDNVLCLAKELLQMIHKQGEKCIVLAAALLKHKVPQEEALFSLWRGVTSEHCSESMLTALATPPQLVHLHCDFKHRPNCSSTEHVGFPLLCALKSLLLDQDKCIERMSMLLALGANLDTRYCNEPTPVHFAASKQEWRIVEFLLDKGADIDVTINGETAREIIVRFQLTLLQGRDYPKRAPSPPSVTDQLFDALYKKGEDAFVELLTTSGAAADVNAHNGRTTLLQRAVLNKFSKAVQELVTRGADVNLMAGNSTPTLLLALRNPELETLGVFVSHKEKLDLRVSVDEGTFLNFLAHEFTSCGEAVEAHRSSFIALVEEAIRQRVYISSIDQFGNTPLEVLGFQCHNNATLFNILLRNGGFLTMDEELVLNTRPEVFTAFFDENVRFYEEFKRHQFGLDRSEVIEASYEFLEPLEPWSNSRGHVAEMLPFLKLSKSAEHQKVLLHSLVTLFLVYKWRKIAFVYILNFLLYLAFTVAFSLHVYALANESVTANITNVNSNFSTVASDSEESESVNHRLIISMFFWCLIFLRETFQIIISYRQYFCNVENYLEVILLFFSCLTFVPQFAGTKLVAAVAISLTYVELTLLIGRHPYTGTYITMFLRVALKSVELLLIFSSFIFAFTFGFYVFFHNLSEPNFFSSLWHSMLKTSMMAAGEFNVDAVWFEVSPGASEIMFLLFLIFVPVVLMNLLNALAVSDTQRVIDETSLLCCVANIQHYTKIESMWLGYSMMDSPGERCYGFVPSSKSQIISNLISLFHSYFRVNVLPFPQNPHTNPEPTHTLKILLEQKSYYPHVYFSYKPPSGTVSYQVFKQPRTAWQFFRHFYFRVLLRGNEDSAVQELRLKKFPSLAPDVGERLVSLGKELSESGQTQADARIELRAIVQKQADQNKDAIENLSSHLSAMEERLQTKLTNQSFVNMERLVRSMSEHDSALLELKRHVLQQQAELQRVSSDTRDVKLSVQQIQADLALIKRMLETLRQ